MENGENRAPALSLDKTGALRYNGVNNDGSRQRAVVPNFISIQGNAAPYSGAVVTFYEKDTDR